MSAISEDDLSRHDGRRLIRESGELFLDDYYQSFLPGFTDLIRLSKDRAYYKDPIKHYGLQLGLLQTLQGLEEASSRGKKLARQQSSADLELQSKRNKYLAKAVKEIADGVAWRTLGHSRFKMRILSQGRYSGHTWGKDGQDAELKRAITAVGNGAFILINDVTNCLRIGDLTLVRPDRRGEPYLTEVKRGELITPRSIAKKVDASKALDKQEKRLIQAQTAIDRKVFPASVADIPVVSIQIPLHDVISGVGAVAKQALQKGGAARMLTPYMRIEALDLPTLAERPDYQELIGGLVKLNKPALFSHSSYDHLIVGATGEVERSSPPYTIFPWPLPVIAKMITGELFVTCTLYREPLEQAFRELGWELIIDEQAFEKYEPSTEAENIADLSGEVLFPGGESEKMIELVYLAHPSGFRLSAFETIVQMAREYLTVKHVVAVAEEMLRRATREKPEFIYPEIDDTRRWI